MTDFTQKGETCRAAKHNGSFSGAGDPIECGWPTCFCYQHDREVVEELREQGWIDGGEAWKLRNEIATLRKALADSVHVASLAAEEAPSLTAFRDIRRICRSALSSADELKGFRNARRLA